MIFRIIHRDNVPWILDNGLHCSNSRSRDPNYVAIGDPELIEKRRRRPVPVPPGGTLGDYVPFYFTPRSPMLHNALTGRRVRRLDASEVVVVVASLRRLVAMGLSAVFTDGHAYASTSQFFCDLAQLARVDWRILQRSDFSRDEDDPGKVVRYQAEALVHGTLSIAGHCALACYDGDTRALASRWVEERGLEVKVVERSAWYPR